MKKQLTKKQARQEFNNLLDEDSSFYIQWNVPYSDENDKPYNEEEIKRMNENNFYEWCSNYDDLKHITKKGRRV